MVQTHKDCCKLLLLQLEQMEGILKSIKLLSSRLDDIPSTLFDTQNMEQEMYKIMEKIEEFDNADT